MDRIPLSPPVIAPLAATEKRVQWSVMIPVYNCASFIPDALASVLAQDLGEDHMQIEVVDDASMDDDVEAIVKQIGRGRVGYYRQSENVGSLRNFETCINRAKGTLVHLLHGDDRVKPGFYAKMKSLFESFPDAGAAICRYSFINTAGVETHLPEAESDKDEILEGWLLRIAQCQRTQYVATVVKREVYEKLGSFYGMTYGEDWEMWVRIARYYPVAYTPEILANYREHTHSISKEKITSGSVMQDFISAIQCIEKHLPPERKKTVLKTAKKNCALFHIGIANSTWNATGNRSLTKVGIKQALHLSKHPFIYYSMLKLYLKIAIDRYANAS